VVAIVMDYPRDILGWILVLSECLRRFNKVNTLGILDIEAFFRLNRDVSLLKSNILALEPVKIVLLIKSTDFLPSSPRASVERRGVRNSVRLL
jgi:hypothetical protein